MFAIFFCFFFVWSVFLKDFLQSLPIHHYLWVITNLMLAIGRITLLSHKTLTATTKIITKLLSLLNTLHLTNFNLVNKHKIRQLKS